MTETNKLKVLVYGGTGSQGSAVVRKLLERGHQPVILTRHPDKVNQAGVQAVAGDITDPVSLEAASRQVGAVSLMIPFFLPDPTQAFNYARNAIDAANTAEVKLIVYNTSGPVIEGVEGIDNPDYDLRREIMDYLQKSPVPSIVIQPTAYMENLLGPWTRNSLLEKDELAYPAEEHAPLGWIATEDVGALIVAALERPQLAGQRFVVSGIENATGLQLAERFTEGLGRPIKYRAMPLEEFGAFLDAAFGPGAGEGAVQGYKFMKDNAARIPMWADMQPVLKALPVEMTSLQEWAAIHRPAFTAS